MGNEVSNEAAGVFGGLGDAIRTMVREEIEAVRYDLEAPVAGEPMDVATLLETDEFKAYVNGCMEKAFQTVLPQLIKRFKAEVEERLSGATGQSVDVDGMINSERMKELLDGRFRQMLLYIKQDVVPKAVQQNLERA